MERTGALVASKVSRPHPKTLTCLEDQSEESLNCIMEKAGLEWQLKTIPMWRRSKT